MLNRTAERGRLFSEFFQRNSKNSRPPSGRFFYAFFMERNLSNGNRYESGCFNSKDYVVAKFGGSSLANADGFRRVAQIIKSDPKRKFIVVSALGKDNNNCQKVTDHLLLCAQYCPNDPIFKSTFALVTKRYLEIANELGVTGNVQSDLRQIAQEMEIMSIDRQIFKEWLISRGEWLSARMLASYIDATFVDAIDVVHFIEKDNVDVSKSYALTHQTLKGTGTHVVPGFYGLDTNGNIKTFQRDGSDITGAHLAAALNVAIYENWTDVDGVKENDPKKDPDAKTIWFITKEEMAELACRGTKVLHPGALEPIWNSDILINIRNTFNPNHPGTIIV